MTDDTIIRRKNRHGVMKDHLRIGIGTAVVEVPRYIRNPTTGRRHDLTKLSDDGYLKPFLAMWWHFTERKSGVIDLDNAPVLSFWEKAWRQVEMENHVIMVKREPSSRFEEMVLEGPR